MSALHGLVCFDQLRHLDAQDIHGLLAFKLRAETLRLVLRIDASKLMLSILLHGSELLQDQMSSSINGRGGWTAGPADRVR